MRLRLLGAAGALAAAVTGTAAVAHAPGTSAREGVVQFALAQQGDDYVWGGNGPAVWDCSGLVKAAFADVGVTLPRWSGDQKRAGTRIPVSSAQRGDLIAYEGHVAIYLGNGKQVAASSGSDAVVVQSVYRGAQYAVRIL